MCLPPLPSPPPHRTRPNHLACSCLELDEDRGTLRIYKSESQQELLSEVQATDIFNCIEPESPDERSQRIFLVGCRWAVRGRESRAAGCDDGPFSHARPLTLLLDHHQRRRTALRRHVRQGPAHVAHRHHPRRKHGA